ncbi:MAG: mannose-6-phosphate isomerase [Chitinophagaceae bacterium]|nr:MAG: mannose-6-phosphate isomerase [Chitinophagaceae bacterium]
MKSNYDKQPSIPFSTNEKISWQGWEDITQAIGQRVKDLPEGKKIVALECYPGLLEEEVLPNLTGKLTGRFYFTKDFMLPETKISELVYPDVTDDEIFGYITRLRLVSFFDTAKMSRLAMELEGSTDEVTFIYGPGATLLAEAGLVIYFDMPRWEGQLRFRTNEVSNLGVSNKNIKASLQYKQAFFVDWRVCDKHKKTLMDRWDFVVDTATRNQPKMVTGKALNEALEKTVSRPFRLVPFFDPGPWGGQWMKDYFELDPSKPNYAWCFDCVPEENSLLVDFNGIIFETPSINLVFAQSRPLLGDAVQARFGDEFPIRFDFLDTMGGGNLSLQVHPTTEYIREAFGMDYTQDESYYMLDAGDDAVVYLGLKDSTNPQQMIDALRDANSTGDAFDADAYVEKWPVRKHDHVLIPAGTVHCSGSNSMVLEISATPYIFTFKLYDWGRMGLDGKPRPINIEHGKQVINWDLRPERTRKELVNAVTVVAEGDGWKEERTGLHEREFIETRRHWFSKKVTHHTNGSVNVLNLVEGREAVIESPTNAFEPFTVHYAETFVIPEKIKEYTIRPSGESEGKTIATMKAFVRTHP